MENKIIPTIRTDCKTIALTAKPICVAVSSIEDARNVFKNLKHVDYIYFLREQDMRYAVCYNMQDVDNFLSEPIIIP